MIVDGKTIATEIYDDTRERVLKSGRTPTLVIITCAPNFETQKYLVLKEKKAAYVGIKTVVLELPSTATTADITAQIEAQVPVAEGIIVQLPLPPQVDTEAVLRAVPVSHDVDGLNPETRGILSPVVGACKAILDHHHSTVQDRHVVIIGAGRLVGIPAYRWFQEMGSAVSLVTKDTVDIAYYTKPADIIVCGAGVPGLLTPEMVKEGVIILDAGTSEDGGVLKGDADPCCAEKAALFTPVPGGIGPITIAVLLQNVLTCMRAL
jgi:methylenetetrahydrofolate dehydrogenase (NADP+)/methenyltetrahydrofolate cyclohydrolase